MRQTLLLVLVLVLGATLSAHAGNIPGLTKDAVPGPVPDRNIVAGPDGNVWVAEGSANRIGRLTPAGDYTTFTVPTPNAGLGTIAAGPDGNMWFTEAAASKIGRITPDGVISEFPLSAGRFPYEITAGLEGNVWFAENDRIGRVSPATGVITEFPLTAGYGSRAIAGGADGNVWLARTRFQNDNTTHNVLVRITPSGTFTEFTLPSSTAKRNYLGARMIVGPDGNVWFTHGNAVGRVSPAGTITLFNVPTPDSEPSGLAVGLDGNIWFTEQASGKIGQLIVSTATENGQATINESELIDEYLRDIVRVPDVPAQANLRAGTLADPPDCKKEAFIVHSWYSPELTHSRVQKIRGSPYLSCADLSAEMHAGLLSTGQVAFYGYIQNGGPDAAENAQLQLHLYPGAAGMVIVSAGVKLGFCDNPPSPGYVHCTWPKLGAGQHDIVMLTVQTFSPDLDTRWNGRWDARIFSPTADPVPGNNISAVRFSGRTATTAERLKFELFEPVTRPTRGH